MLRSLALLLAVGLSFAANAADAALAKKPMRKVGQPCEGNSHCRNKLICWEHKCAPKRKLGESCRLWSQILSDENDCQEPLNCWKEAQEPSRQGYGTPDGKCAPRRKVGETCLYNRSFGSDCVKGAKCARTEDLDGVCSKGKRGQACSDDENCRGDLVCVQHSCQ